MEKKPQSIHLSEQNTKVAPVSNLYGSKNEWFQKIRLSEEQFQNLQLVFFRNKEEDPRTLSEFPRRQEIPKEISRYQLQKKRRLCKDTTSASTPSNSEIIIPRKFQGYP
jgi:hypothetical protein